MRKARGPVALFFVLALLVSGCTLPDLDDYRARRLDQTTFLYASDGTRIMELHATEDRVVLSHSEIPRWLGDAAVAIEDRRFYSHHGIDPEAIVRAAFVNAAEGEVVEGGSTITQQLVKNLYVGGAETISRKIDEAALAWQLEDRLTKEQILTRYLNTVYFGEGAYGAQAAAKTYFGIDAADLTLAQAALLAGLITAPNHFNPYVRMSSAVGRRNVVLRLMREERMITREQEVRARHEPVVLRSDHVEVRYPYPYFVDYFKRWFLTNPRFGETYDERYQLLFSGGLRITTTIDPDMQAAAEEAVSSVLAYPGDPDAAVTVIDPRTGYVRAMVGGDEQDYWDDDDAGRVNLATGAGGSGRQTGSAFKPFALVAALEHGIGPDTVFPAPASIDLLDGTGTVWHVTNADGRSYGALSLRSATIDSVNTVYAQLIQRVSAESVVEVAERMGIRCCTRVGMPQRDLDPYLSAVLGSNEANTLEMASAYGTLATGGKSVVPTPVVTITDAEGEVIWQADPDPQQVLSAPVAAAANDILQDAVLYGTGSAANIGRPQIGKTGTDDRHDNAWFVGAVPQLSAAVWVGYHEGQIPMEPPTTRITVFGGTWPAQIWRLLMQDATEGMEELPFPSPEVEYVQVAVDVTQDPYCLPNAYTLPTDVDVVSFITGTEPTEICTTPTTVQEVLVPSVVGFPQPQAIAQLELSGFYVDVQPEPSTQPAGTVIATLPNGGTTALQTSTVTLVVASPVEPGG